MTQIFIGKLNILTASKAYLQMQWLNDFTLSDLRKHVVYVSFFVSLLTS